MARVTEKIPVKVDDRTIEVVHDGIMPYNEWSNEGKARLHKWVRDGLEEGKTGDWLPFANFESTVAWGDHEYNNKEV